MYLAVVSLAALLAAGPLVIEPGNMATTYQSLKDAVAKKDAGQVKTLAAKTCALAREVISSTAPEDADEKEAWQKHMEFAREVETYSEYALYATAVQAPPAATVDLLATLEQQNPKSKYLDSAYDVYFYALHQTGADAKIPGIAEKAIVNFPDNDDVLAVLAETAYSRKQGERALGYARRLTAAVNKRGKPEAVSAASWERKRSAELGSGYWIAGVVQAEKGVYFDADKDLRAALPFVETNEARKATALFYLGLANYELGKMTMRRALVLQAVKFSQEAAAIKGPLAQQAWHNAQVMKDEAARMR
jgi:tetratricopeptide (TPR) repeat protein